MSYGSEKIETLFRISFFFLPFFTGMKAFENGGNFYAIPCRITYFSSLQEDRKIYLQNAIKQGINDGFVKPVFQKLDTMSFEGCVDQQ